MRRRKSVKPRRTKALHSKELRITDAKTADVRHALVRDAILAANASEVFAVRQVAAPS
jgi:hypothetical protein